MAKDKIAKAFLAITKDKFTIDTIAEMIATKHLAEGDIVRLNGYYSAGDGANHIRIISKTNDGSGVLLANGLYANIVHDGEVNVSWFGARGNGVTDNRKFIQDAFNYSSKIEACDVKFDSGLFVCNGSVTLEETPELELSYFKISGTGFDCYDRGRNNRINNETKIKFNNIGHDRGGFEFLGKDNGWATSIQVENIDLDATNDTNHKWSSALKVGSSNFSIFERCSFKGKKGVNVLSGIDKNTYAFINTEFRNCRISTREKTGFSIFNGIIFSKENTTYSPNDNAVYSSCLFEGTSMFFSYNEKVVNCMTILDTEHATQNYIFTVANDNVNPFFDGYEVDFRNAMYIASSSNVSIDGTYFEDYESAIVLYPFKGATIDNINIVGCHFSRYKNIIPSFPESPRQILIKNALRNEGAVRQVYLGNNTFLGRGSETILCENPDTNIVEMFNKFTQGEDFRVNGSYNKLISTEFGALNDTSYIYDKITLNSNLVNAYYSDLLIQHTLAERSSRIKKIEVVTNKKIEGGVLNVIVYKNDIEGQLTINQSNFIISGSNYIYTVDIDEGYVNKNITIGDRLSFGFYSSISDRGTSALLRVVCGF